MGIFAPALTYLPFASKVLYLMTPLGRHRSHPDAVNYDSTVTAHRAEIVKQCHKLSCHGLQNVRLGVG
jgi:hypothetical protein